MQLIKELPNKSDKIISFALIYLSSLFADKNGEFKCKEFTLHKLTGISERHIERVINKLLDIDYIECISRNKLRSVPWESRKYICSKYPNVYQLNLLKPNASEKPFYSFDMVDLHTDDFQYYFWDCYLNYLNMCDIKPSRREKENINKYIDNNSIA
jgi:hypothetical protein